MGMDERAHAGVYLHPRMIMLHAINLRGGTDVGIASRAPQSQGFGTGTARSGASVAACALCVCGHRHGQGSLVLGCGCTQLGATHSIGSYGHHVPQQNASFCHFPPGRVRCGVGARGRAASGLRGGLRRACSTSHV